VKPISLTLSNFQSHRDTELDFSPIGLAVLSGPNGAGKSTIIDGIRFALFGAVRGGNLDSAVTEGEAVCRVGFRFALNGDTYMVSRQRSTKGSGKTTTVFHRLTADGPVVLDGKSERETQEAICRTLCMTDDLFTQTACANQGNAAAFPEAKPSARKEVLADILDLAAWERRAETARAMARDAQGEAESLDRQAESLMGQALQVPGLETELAALSFSQSEAETCLAADQQMAEAMQYEREELLTRQIQDVAARRELVELEGRQQSVALSASAATDRATKLRTRVAARAEAEAAVTKARAAQAAADRLEGLRQEAARLDQATLLAESKWQTARAGHAGKVKLLEQRVSSARIQHAQAIKALEAEHAQATKQAEPLERVPCVAIGQNGLAKQCPLIEQARGAKAVLPGLLERLEAARAETPWANLESELEAARAETAGAQESADLEKIRADRKLIHYQPVEHRAATATAGQLETWTGRLHQVEEAAAQLPEAEAAEKGRRAESQSLEARIAEVKAALGEPPDWPTLLEANDRKAKAAAEQVAHWRAELERIIAARGGLAARLEAAQEAAAKIEPLRAEVAKCQRRRQLLTILGNPQTGAFGKNGIPALLIEQAIPQLEAAANDVLATLSDGRMSLELRTQKEGGNGLSETLDLVVCDQHGPRLYETFSGGERTRVDLALRAGLSQFLAARAGARCELLILDEPPGLDEQGQDELCECLGKLSAHFATILLITHIDRLKDALPCRLDVTKDERGSHVEVTLQ